jgi:hypothetical protein
VDLASAFPDNDGAAEAAQRRPFGRRGPDLTAAAREAHPTAAARAHTSPPMRAKRTPSSIAGRPQPETRKYLSRAARPTL